jgi:hypothetical protein
MSAPGTARTARRPGPSRTRAAATVAVALAAAATAWLLLWPCSYSGARSHPDGTTTQTCTSLVAVNGWRVAWLLAIPVAITALGLLSAIRGRRAITLTLALLMLASCVVAILSIGIFYLPSAVALLVAATGRPASGVKQPIDRAVEP